MARLFSVCVLLLAACGSSDPEMPDQYEFGGDRPVFLEVPTAYDHAEPTPLLVVLHGFGANAYTQLAYTGLGELVEEAGVLMVAPEGTVDQDGKQFWNATEECCDNYDTGVDDASYLIGLIDEISAVWNVDPDRVYLFGHSNGGYMSYRMACDYPDQIAAIASLAGLVGTGSNACDPTDAVSVLQIHGTLDDRVPYSPGAEASAELWAGYDGCSTDLQAASGQLDLDTTIEGEETTVEFYDACPEGVAVELWTIEGGSHTPPVTDDFRAQIWDFFESHPGL